jgi:aspartate/methionine/tyrosine aminotransferase
MDKTMEDRMGVLDVEESNIPIDRETLRRIIDSKHFDVSRASIREMNNLIDTIEHELDLRFIRMEFGIPGLPTHRIAVDAEIEALRDRRVGHVYAPFEGLPALKEEAARFVKLFMNLDVPSKCCIPVVGAMEGCFASLALAGRMRPGANKVICLEPGFPVNKLQLRFLGLERVAIDFYDHRGDELIRAVEDRAKQGDVCAILWSSPNNPSWVTLKDSELQGLGRICDRYDVLAIEDLAYFGMDMREDYYRPGEPPYQPSVLEHTQRGISVVSSSKIFSYAGQRIALAITSPQLFETEAVELSESLGSSNVGHALLHGILYPIAACVPESPQYGLLALLRAANGGDRSVFEPASVYARRAAAMKPLFLDNGFHLVYDNDLGQPLADGFYFTIAYPGFENGYDLVRELLHYGISAITLETTGSCRKEGLRACVSMVGEDRFDVLEDRLRKFRRDHANPS